MCVCAYLEYLIQYNYRIGSSYLISGHVEIINTN